MAFLKRWWRCDGLPMKWLLQGTAEAPCCIFVLESHREADQAKWWGSLSSCTLDLTLVIGHALFEWDKVITCHLFRHCPLQYAARAYCGICLFCKYSKNPVNNIFFSEFKRGSKLVLLSSELVKTNHFASSLGFPDLSDRFRGAFSVALHEF